MDHTSSFTEMLQSQEETFLPETFPYGSSQLPTQTSSFCEDSPPARKGRKKWSVTDDLVLVSAWLNTSKDPVVGNEQKADAFWKRIAAYFAASTKVERGVIQCKSRWQKMNDLVCKFCGAYAAAARQKTSGQNDADTVQLAHKIFFNDHQIKFNLHHVWEELRNDQKWCEIASWKAVGSGKKRKYDDGSQSESSQATSNLGDQPTQRPPGVKAMKAAAKAASGKRSIAVEEAVGHFETMCSIKEKDLAVKEKDLAVKEKDLAVKEKDIAVKEKVSKIALLESLISKKETLSEAEEALKKKLLTEMLTN